VGEQVGDRNGPFGSRRTGAAALPRVDLHPAKAGMYFETVIEAQLATLVQLHNGVLAIGLVRE